MTSSLIMMLYWNVQIDPCCMFPDFVQWLWRHIKASRSKTHHFYMNYLFLNKINMNCEMGAKWSNQRLEQKNMDWIPSGIRDQRFGIPFHQIWKPHHALINLRICYCNGMGKYALVVSAHCVNLNIYDVRTLMLPWQFNIMLEYQVNDLKHILLILLVILCLYVYSRPLEERQVWWLADISWFIQSMKAPGISANHGEESYTFNVSASSVCTILHPSSPSLIITTVA